MPLSFKQIGIASIFTVLKRILIRYNSEENKRSFQGIRKGAGLMQRSTFQKASKSLKEKENHDETKP